LLRRLAEDLSRQTVAQTVAVLRGHGVQVDRAADYARVLLRDDLDRAQDRRFRGLDGIVAADVVHVARHDVDAPRRDRAVLAHRLRQVEQAVKSARAVPGLSLDRRGQRPHVHDAVRRRVAQLAPQHRVVAAASRMDLEAIL
jgi:hypothetical protein